MTAVVESHQMPPKTKPDGVYVFHSAVEGISFGVKLDGTEVTGALAVCAPRDQFSKKKAQKILRGRLDKKRFGLMTFRLGEYEGTAFKKDVFDPLMDYVRVTAKAFSPYRFMMDGEVEVKRGQSRRRVLRLFSSALVKKLEQSRS